MKLTKYLKIFCLSAFLFFSFFAQAQQTKTNQGQKKQRFEFIIVEHMPEYPGGNKALKAFIENNVTYPSEAKEKGIVRKVYVRFLVKKDGYIDSVKIARSANPLLDEEALRVIKLLPRWKPGKQQDSIVAVWWIEPVNFGIDKKK